MPKERRSVIVSDKSASAQGRPRLWAFGYADLAEFLEMKEGAVRQAVARDKFNPASLESIMEFRAARVEPLTPERRASLEEMAPMESTIVPGGRDRERGSLTIIPKVRMTAARRREIVRLATGKKP